MKVYVVCFTVCFFMFLLWALPMEKVQAVQSVIHDVVQLNNGTEDEDAS